jgi:hypothetical protein
MKSELAVGVLFRVSESQTQPSMTILFANHNVKWLNTRMGALLRLSQICSKKWIHANPMPFE